MNFKKITGTVYGQRKIEESFSYPYKNIRKMFCACGYEGICVLEVCKKCKQKVMVQIQSVSKSPVYSEVYNLKQEGQNVYLTLVVREAFKQAKEYYSLRSNKIYLVFDGTSGELFANGKLLTYNFEEPEIEKILETEQRDALPPIRRGFFIDEMRAPNFPIILAENSRDPIFSLEGPENENLFMERIDLSENIDLLTEFFTHCAKVRGITYTDVTRLLQEENGLQKMIILLRLPVLEYAAELSIDTLSKEIAQELDEAKNGDDVWKILIGHSGKEVKKWALKDRNYFNYLFLWGPFVKKQDNLAKLARSFTFYTPQPLRDLYHLSIDLFKDETEPTLFHTKDQKREKFRAGMGLIQSTHKDETVWVNRLLQFKKGDESREAKNEEELYHYICDMGEMHIQIKKTFPEFLPKKTHSIKALHDELSSWIKKIKTPKLVFPLTKEQLAMEEDGFVFAKDTHTLVEVGDEMRICVGSYRSRAYYGDCAIVLYKEKNEVKVCIELDRNHHIVQAKMYGNERPTNYYREKILAWAEKHKLPIKTRDLRTMPETDYHRMWELVLNQ